MKIPQDPFAVRRKKSRPSIYRNPNLLSLIAIFILALIFWWVYVEHTEANDRVIAGSNADMYVYHLPVREYGFSRLKAGEVPLYNPYTNCGGPFLATFQAALFYPLNFPHLFLPAGLAVGLIYLLHIFLAGAFMYLWMREIGIGSLASAFAGTAYMLCSFVAYVLTWPHIVLTHVWIPLVFLFIHRTFRRGRLTDMALLGIVVGCQFLAGYMQGFVYTLYGAFAYLGFLTLVKLFRRKEEPRFLGRSFGFTLAGLTLVPALLTAFQWIPTLQLSALSTRPPGGLTHEAILFGGSLYPSTFFAALVNPDSYKWSQYTLYPGVLVLVLALFAFIHWKRWREIIFFLALAAMSSLIAFGTHTPVFNLFTYVPTGDWFRLPNRLLILTAFSVATLAGIGCNYLLEEVLAKPEAVSKQAFGIGIFISICAVFLLLLPKSAGLYVFLLLVGFLLAIRARSAAAVGALAILLVALDLSLYVSNPVTYPWITPEVFPKLKEEKEFLRKNVGLDRVHVFHKKNDWKNFLLNSNFGLVERVRETGGYESLSLQRYAEFSAYLDTGGNPSYSLPFTGSLRWTSESVHPGMLNILGARYIVEDPGRGLYPEKADPNRMPKYFRLKKVFSGQLNIYENPDALPRAFYTKKVEVIRDRYGVLERLADNSFDYRSTLILEEQPELSYVSEGTEEPSPPQVLVEERGESHVNIIVDAPAPGLIFLNDIFLAGWHARIDGKDSKIYRADYLFMAIPVDSGKHSIDVQYLPAGFHAGKWISFVSALALSLLLAFDVARNRAKKMSPWEAKAGSAIPSLTPKKK